MNTLRILMYHKVREQADFLSVTAPQLRAQLLWLKARYNMVSLSQVVAYLQRGEALPPRAVCITFDDGFMNNYTAAYPIFKELDIPFCIFLVADFVGKTIVFDGEQQSFLSEAELKKMEDMAQYAYHSVEHKSIMDIDENQWADEIMNAKQKLDKLPITMQPIWAYTYGSCPRKNKEQMAFIENIFQNNSFIAAFRIGNRINKHPISNPFLMQRIDIRGNESNLKFKWKVMFGKLF